jgi:YD repeat-containing protein
MNPNAFASPPASACDLGTAGAFGPDRITKAIYDAANQVTQQRTAMGTADEAAEVTATYRPNGQVETVTDGEGRTTTYQYDGHDRAKSTLYPATAQHPATSETLTYESVGGTQNSPLVANVLNRAGETIAFGYDALGRMISKDVPNSGPYVSDSYFRYDNFGRMIWAGLNPTWCTASPTTRSAARFRKTIRTSAPRTSATTSRGGGRTWRGMTASGSTTATW